MEIKNVLIKEHDLIGGIINECMYMVCFWNICEGKNVYYTHKYLCGVYIKDIKHIYHTSNAACVYYVGIVYV